jgi:COP9 signalosome complex subunit 4
VFPVTVFSLLPPCFHPALNRFYPPLAVLEHPITTSRGLLVSLIASLESSCLNRSISLESTKQLAKAIIDKIAPRAVSYEEQLVRACEFLSGLYQDESAFQQAADTLARIDLESGMRQVDPRVKVDKYLKIAHLYLEDGTDVGSADAFVKKAASLLSSLDEEKDKELVLQYTSCSARILDRKNKFTEAAAKYIDLSKQLGEGATVLGLGRKEALECVRVHDSGSLAPRPVS